MVNFVVIEGVILSAAYLRILFIPEWITDAAYFIVEDIFGITNML